METESPPRNLTPGERLRIIRESQGKGLRVTAREAKMSPAHLSKIERNLGSPSTAALVRLGRVLGLKNLVDTVGLFWQEPPPGTEGRP